MAAFVLTNDSVFNVLAFGADPNHNVDSTIAIQKAFCAAICVQGGTVYFPPGNYIVTSTINVACDGIHGVNVLGASGSGGLGLVNIDYQGPDGTACFAITGMNYSHWQGIGVNLGGNGTAANQVAFDFQVTASKLGQGSNMMQGCNVSIQGRGGGHIGYRFGQYNDNNPADPYTDQGSSISDTTLLNVTIDGDYQGSGHPPSTSIGMQFGGSQVKPSRVIGCALSGLGCDYLAGSIAALLTQNVAYGQMTLPVNDATLFKANGTNTRYVVIGLSEICSVYGRDYQCRRMDRHSYRRDAGSLGDNTTS
jgi:hypothetical protein